MISITFRFENCENVTVPKKYIKTYRWEQDSFGKLETFQVVFKSDMIYTERWVIPFLTDKINDDPAKRRLFKRISSGDICWIAIQESETEGQTFEAPIEPDTDVFYKPNPWQVFDKETKTLTIKKQ